MGDRGKVGREATSRHLHYGTGKTFFRVAAAAAAEFIRLCSLSLTLAFVTYFKPKKIFLL